jgi:hypothetical protein
VGPLEGGAGKTEGDVSRDKRIGKTTDVMDGKERGILNIRQSNPENETSLGVVEA